MARGFSKAIITGNLTRDPELRTTTSGTNVCSFSVAVNRTFKGADAENKEDARAAVDPHVTERDVRAVFRADPLAVVDVMANDIRLAVGKGVHAAVMRHAQHVGGYFGDADDRLLQIGKVDFFSAAGRGAEAHQGEGPGHGHARSDAAADQHDDGADYGGKGGQGHHKGGQQQVGVAALDIA